jgi:hypothetical protein
MVSNPPKAPAERRVLREDSFEHMSANSVCSSSIWAMRCRPLPNGMRHGRSPLVLYLG